MPAGHRGLKTDTQRRRSLCLTQYHSRNSLTLTWNLWHHFNIQHHQNAPFMQNPGQVQTAAPQTLPTKRQCRELFCFNVHVCIMEPSGVFGNVLEHGKCLGFLKGGGGGHLYNRERDLMTSYLHVYMSYTAQKNKGDTTKTHPKPEWKIFTFIFSCMCWQHKPHNKYSWKWNAFAYGGLDVESDTKWKWEKKNSPHPTVTDVTVQPPLWIYLRPNRIQVVQKLSQNPVCDAWPWKIVLNEHQLWSPTGVNFASCPFHHPQQ